MRSLRLLPVLILTSLMLLGLKGFNLVAGPGSTLSGVDLAVAQQADPAADLPEEAAEDAPADAMADEAAPTQEPAQDATIDFPLQTSREALLERLGERREVMEGREQDLRVREQLLAAAERRLEERMAELEALEARVSAAADAEDQRESQEIARLVLVYSAMRAKDAAAIFDLLDLPILMEVANAMNPRKMADILGEMTPESARRLTIALAGMSIRTPVQAPANTMSELPRIEGVPVQ